MPGKTPFTRDRHERAAHALGELIARIRLERVDPVAGALRLPAARRQPLPEGAGAPTPRYHRLFAAELQEWWSPLRTERSGAGEP